MYRRILRAVGAMLVAVTAGLAVLPGTSYAASGLDTEFGKFTNGAFGAWVPARWRIGDCVMDTALARNEDGDFNYTRVRVGRPDSAGRTAIEWFGATRTWGTPVDVWWMRVTLQTQFGTTIVVGGWMRSPDMDVIDRLYTFHTSSDVTMDPQLFPLIASARMEVNC